ncbi:hypothetical protein DIPPA_00504 [Diplonema papillatum]|nr:hypothetical protein DIPPA_00669 [Diplonema papillatum]KAJ9449811.1 hypothetical protein DIPPA_00504 [Diplonema papillatum]
MTTARVGLDEYCKKHQIEDHLTEAVNACYAAQSEHELSEKLAGAEVSVAGRVSDLANPSSTTLPFKQPPAWPACKRFRGSAHRCCCVYRHPN